MHIDPRPGGTAAIRKIVLHLNAGPEIEGGARSLALYLDTIEGGYHEVVDDKTFIVLAGPDKRVYGAAGMNDRGYHICVVGNLQSAQQWKDAYSNGELKIAEQRVAAGCHAFALPPAHLTDAQVAADEARGICDHWAVNRAIQHGDHVDVGPGFPWPDFMAGVVADYGGTSSEGPDMPQVVACLLGGYWICRSDGSIYAYGNAKHYGAVNVPPRPTTSPVTSMAATPSGLGYFQATKDGGLYAFGDAKYLGHP